MSALACVVQRLCNGWCSGSRARGCSKSTPELLRGLLVFQLCQLRPLVTHAEQLMKVPPAVLQGVARCMCFACVCVVNPPCVCVGRPQLSYKVLGTRATNFLAKATFFGHFCAGEDSEGIAPTVKKLESYGVGSILDCTSDRLLVTFWDCILLRRLR